MPLAFRPGVLTQDYLRGRRASYTPPFRMYLILSVAFFLLATLGGNPGADLTFNVDENGGANIQLNPGDGEKDAAMDPKPNAVPDAVPDKVATRPPRELTAEEKTLIDTLVKRLPDKEEQARARKEMEAKLASASPEELAVVNTVFKDPCGTDSLKVDIGAFGKQYGPRLRDACRKIMSDTPTFGRALFENIPKMMFVFLPLIAAVIYVLYLGSGRYYVEHLLFVVHYHAFFFLGGLVILLVERLATWTKDTTAGAAFGAAGGFLIFLFALYVPYYLYRAMRRVYGQGRIVTLIKYSILGIAYLFCMVITGLALLFYTALSL